MVVVTFSFLAGIGMMLPLHDEKFSEITPLGLNPRSLREEGALVIGLE
jgi:hypothetical protein